MMAQYIEIKSANHDSLLFYRMGDFYELFFHDAEIASRALGIALTKRGKHAGQDIPMCGVPIHAADDYLQKLIALGHRVAVCEQLENPAEAKKRGSKAVVRRDVTRLVTPATITEEKLLEPSRANWLVALGRVKGEEQLAIAAIDISTGGFRISKTTLATLLSDLQRVDPSELIVPEGLFHDRVFKSVKSVFGRLVQPLPNELFSSSDGDRRLKRFFDIDTLAGAGEFTRSELSAAGGALAYIEKTQIAEKPSLQLPQRDGDADILLLDAATRTNLELERTLSGNREGSLLRCMDRTVTAGGSRMLAERLRAPLVDTVEINARLDAVSWAMAQSAKCDDIRSTLKGFPDVPRALSRLSLNRGGPRDMLAIHRGLDIAARMSTDRPGGLPSACKSIWEKLASTPKNVHQQLTAVLDDEVPLLARDGGFVRSGFDNELDEQRKLRDDSRRVIAGLQAKYADETGVKSLKIKHNNVLGYFIEVTALNASALSDTDEAKAQYIHRQTLANQMRFTTTELAELETKIANAAGRALEIELAIFDKMLAEIVHEADAIRDISDAIFELDVHTSLAELALAEGYCRPLIDDGLAFQIVGARHPVVEQALRKQAADPFVSNDCDLSPVGSSTQGAIKLLTGPNMGGKSTYLRQNALIAIMAQCGSFVPAASAHIGVVHQIFSRVGASDDLAQGRSTFMVEMVETAAILNQATDRALVILDEIGRGTATFDGLSIAWATLEYLHENNKCRALFATHFHELTALANTLAHVSNLTMKVREWEGDLVFLHQVGEGAADRSYGVQVARLAGLPGQVVSRALDVLDQLEAQGRDTNASKLIDDLPLFSAAKHAPAPIAQDANPVLAALDEVLPDELTPREALDALYRLKALQHGK
ncbi:MAG: DNA mismatch repair protein MutS [Pseudomonadota bacterium]